MKRSSVQLTKARAKGRSPDALLGPWCITRSGPRVPTLSEGAEPRDFVEIAEAFPDVYRRLLDALTESLNTTFGIVRSARYWALVTHPLLYHYVVSFLVKGKVVERALLTGEREASEARFAFPDHRSTPLLYSDLRVAYEEDDRFNLELFSLVCRGRGVPGTAHRRQEWIHHRPRGPRDRLRRRARACYVRATEARRAWHRPPFASLRDRGILYKDMDSRFASTLAEAAGLRFIPLGEVVNLRSRLRLAPDRALRRRARWRDSDPVIDGVLQGLRFHLPVHQLEAYPDLLRGARRLLDRAGTPEAVLFSILERPGYRVLAAEAMHRGARIVSIQHGGNYGESVFAASEVAERTFSDRFVTFGWRKDPAKDVPAGGFRTARLTPGPPPSGEGDLLLVAPLFQEYPHHVNWSPTDRQRERHALLEELPPEVRRRLVVRMRPGRTASARLEREWLAPFPEVRIDPGDEPIDAVMRRSSLVLIGYVFSTTLLEAVKMDRPFLVLDSGFEELLSAEARPVYRALRESGLVRTDPVETARDLPGILGDVAGWWDDPARKEATARFRERFAREADLEAWTELMRDLVQGGRAA